VKYKRRARRLAVTGFGLMITIFIVGRLRVFPRGATAGSAGSTCSYARIVNAAGGCVVIIGILLVLGAAGFAIARVLKPHAGRHRMPATEKAATM
jgi:hypothetical protein